MLYIMKLHRPLSFYVSLSITKLHAERLLFRWSRSNHVGALTGKAVQSESGRPRPQENAQACGGAVLQRHGCPHHHN